MDDEKGIVDGLKILIKRNVPNCKIVGCAYNGIEGVEKIMQLKPDIVITDICMPQVDGLEMIKTLQNKGCESKFIILSGYSEFEYAKKGIALGVKFYINKPVEEDELFDSIEKVRVEICKEKANIEKALRLKNNYENNIKKLKDFVLRDVLDSGFENINDIEYMLDSIEFPIYHTQYVCAIIDTNNESAIGDFSYKSDINNQIAEFLSKYASVNIVRYVDQQVAIIVTNKKTIDTERLFSDFLNIRIYLENDKNIKSAIGIGNVYNSFNEISRSFEEARQALNYKVIRGTNSIIVYREIEKISKNKEIFTDDKIIKLESCLESMDFLCCKCVIDDLFRDMSLNKNLSIYDLQIQSVNILMSGMRKMSLIQLQLNGFLGKNILELQHISQFKTLNQLKNWVTNTIKSIIEIREMQNVTRKKDVIDKVKDYIIENYDKNITLAELSSQFFINPYYLSQLFKEKTGTTYLNFVMETRINKAKELLEKTDLKIYEICESVGYSDTNYFSKLFERFAGVRPTEYKKKIETYQKH